MQHIIDRFISYVTIDTESDPNSTTTPSSQKQWDLANKLVEELKTIGLQDVSIDDKAYIMATLPSNVEHEVPTIGFISHFDTSPDFSGANVKPQVISNYDGGDIVLNADKNIVLSPKYFKDLLKSYRLWNTLFSTQKSNTERSELVSPRMKKLDVERIILM
jgi:tripeptide aminopeptidase